MSAKHMTVKDAAEYLGITRQRVEAVWRDSAHDFPQPIAGSSPRAWNRTEIEALAEARWWGTRPYRSR